MDESVSLKVAFNLDRVASFIRDNGGKASKTKIVRALNLDDEIFWAAVDYGNEVKCLKTEPGNTIVYKKDFKINEESFYPAVELAIRRLWQEDNFHVNEFYLEKTARTNSKIAGPWTRPDFTLVCHKKFPWTIGGEFDVVTFEVKRPDSCNVLAVFEALSHATTATRACVVFPISPTEWAELDPAQESRVKDECSKHGVGLILIENVYLDPKPIHVIKATKRELDHDKTSNFLDAVMTSEAKQRIASWKG